MSHFYSKFHRRETLLCDIQNCHPANWPIRLLEINMRYNNVTCQYSLEFKNQIVLVHLCITWSQDLTFKRFKINNLINRVESNDTIAEVSVTQQWYHWLKEILNARMKSLYKVMVVTEWATSISNERYLCFLFLSTICVFFMYLQVKAVGQALWDAVIRHLQLTEADYFGLQYDDSHGLKVCVDIVVIYKWQRLTMLAFSMIILMAWRYV